MRRIWSGGIARIGVGREVRLEVACRRSRSAEGVRGAITGAVLGVRVAASRGHAVSGDHAVPMGERKGLRRR